MKDCISLLSKCSANMSARPTNLSGLHQWPPFLSLSALNWCLDKSSKHKSRPMSSRQSINCYLFY